MYSFFSATISALTHTEAKREQAKQTGAGRENKADWNHMGRLL